MDAVMPSARLVSRVLRIASRRSSWEASVLRGVPLVVRVAVMMTSFWVRVKGVVGAHDWTVWACEDKRIRPGRQRLAGPASPRHENAASRYGVPDASG